MIITELYNGQGLGNQLWCYVVTRVIAKRHGYVFGIKSPEKFKGADFLKLDFGNTVLGGTGPEGGPPTTLPDGIAHYYRERAMFHPKNGADIRLHDEQLMTVRDNTKIEGVMQDEHYIAADKEHIRSWLTPTHDCMEYSSPNICVINFRGGEYMRHKELLLPRSYWHHAMEHMRRINPHITFIVITDDVVGAKSFFPDLPVHHFSIGKDYTIILNAHYLILSNSSFAWFPAWLNTKLNYCIAPMYWARHNVSDGYWSLGYSMTTGWMYQDKHGTLSDYATVVSAFTAYRQAHPDYFVARAEPAQKTILQKILKKVQSLFS